MLSIWQLGDKIIHWLQNIANIFSLPMNSPEFQSLMTIETDSKVLNVLWYPYNQTIIGIFNDLGAGGVSLFEFVMTAGIGLFVSIILIKFILPTS